MPRLKTRDPRKRFASLYRFIETDLTAENWPDLLYRAARFNLRPRALKKPINGRKHLRRPRGAARWRGVTPDLDLAGAQSIQKRLRHELAAIERGETWPAITTMSRLIDHRFDRLKRLLVRPPRIVAERRIGSVRALTIDLAAYRATVKRKCPSCGRPARRYTCGERNCVVEDDNARRKARRESTTKRT
jgi:hypothetical protein